MYMYYHLLISVYTCIIAPGVVTSTELGFSRIATQHDSSPNLIPNPSVLLLVLSVLAVVNTGFEIIDNLLAKETIIVCNKNVY